MFRGLWRHLRDSPLGYRDDLSLAAVALTVHLLAFAILPRVDISPDLEEYRYLARGLLTHGEYGFREDWRQNPILSRSLWRFLYDDSGMVRTPGYPVFLAALERLFGPYDTFLRPLLALLNAVAAVLVARIAAPIVGGLGARTAGALFAVNPNVIQAANLGGREALLVALVGLSVYLLMLSARRTTLRRAVLTGLCLGAASLVKETALLVGLVGAVWFAVMAHRERRILAVGSMVVLMMLPVLGWVARNSIHAGRLTGMSNMSGLNLWFGFVQPGLLYLPSSWKDADWTHGVAPAEQPQLDPYRARDGADADRRLMELTRRHVRENPGYAVARAVRNVAVFWSPVSRTVLMRGVERRPIELLSLVYFAVLLTLVPFSLFRRWNRPEALLFIGIIAVVSAAHALVDSAPRYRLLIEPLITVSAVWSLTLLVPNFAGVRREVTDA